MLPDFGSQSCGGFSNSILCVVCKREREIVADDQMISYLKDVSHSILPNLGFNMVPAFEA